MRTSNSTTTVSTPARPWQREPWFWFVWGLPAVAVVASLVAAFLAIRGADRLVEDDYYSRGIAIGADIERQRAAFDLGLRADVIWPDPADASGVMVVIGSTRVAVAPARLHLRLIDPGHHRPDRVATLLRVALQTDQRGATYRGRWQTPASDAVADPAGASWQVTLETDAWRIDGTYPEYDAADGAAGRGGAHALHATASP